MFVEKVYHGIKCDRCKESHKDDCGNENFDSDIEAIDSASEHMWQFVKEIDKESFLHYCPECCEAMEEEDNKLIVIKYLIEKDFNFYGSKFKKGHIVMLRGDKKNQPCVNIIYPESSNRKCVYYEPFFEEYKQYFKRLPND